jgi:hypothetical protein
MPDGRPSSDKHGSTGTQRSTFGRGVMTVSWPLPAAPPLGERAHEAPEALAAHVRREVVPNDVGRLFADLVGSVGTAAGAPLALCRGDRSVPERVHDRHDGGVATVTTRPGTSFGGHDCRGAESSSACHTRPSSSSKMASPQ